MAIVKELASSDTLVIAATGLANKLNLPVNAFFKKSGLLSASRIILTDPTKNLTLAGLPPEYPSFHDIVGYLRQEIADISPDKLIITGTSGGAHTALLLGHLLKANHVVAFAPYPYLSISELKTRKDPTLQSMRRVVLGLNSLPKKVKKYLDLRNVLSEWNSITQYDVHVSRYNKWDYRRMAYLLDLPKVSVISHPYSTHAIAEPLARQDILRKCFKFPYEHEHRLTDAFLHLLGMTKQIVRHFN